MKRLLVTAAMLLVVAGLSTVGLAATSAAATGGYAAQDDPKKQEYDAYAAWYAAYKAGDAAKSLELGKAFVEKFPSSQYADFVKKDNLRANGVLFNQAMQAKNTAEMIRLGNNALAADPENLDYLYLLSVGIRNEMGTGNFSHASELTSYSQKAMTMIESGKVPNVITDKTKWNQNAVLAYFNQGLADVEIKANNKDKGLAYYEKAAALDSGNPLYFLKSGSLHQDKYAAAATKFGQFPDADRDAASENKPEAKPEVKAMLDEANKQADAVITAWTRFLALSDGKKEYADVRPKVETALTELYKYRHNGSVEGLQKLIDQNKTSGPPATASSSNR